MPGGQTFFDKDLLWIYFSLRFHKNTCTVKQEPGFFRGKNQLDV